MKKFLSMTLLFTAMFLTFSACSSDDDDFDYPMDTLYGSWEGISINVNGGWVNITEYPYTKFAFSIKFNSDGTYSGRGYFGNGSRTYTAKGKTIITYVNGKEYCRTIYDCGWFRGNFRSKSHEKIRKEQRMSIPLIICLIIWGGVTLFRGLTKK